MNIKRKIKNLKDHKMFYSNSFFSLFSSKLKIVHCITLLQLLEQIINVGQCRHLTDGTFEFIKLTAINESVFYLFVLFVLQQRFDPGDFFAFAIADMLVFVGILTTIQDGKGCGFVFRFYYIPNVFGNWEFIVF